MSKSKKRMMKIHSLKYVLQQAIQVVSIAFITSAKEGSMIASTMSLMVAIKLAGDAYLAYFSMSPRLSPLERRQALLLGIGAAVLQIFTEKINTDGVTMMTIAPLLLFGILYSSIPVFENLVARSVIRKLIKLAGITPDKALISLYAKAYKEHLFFRVTNYKQKKVVEDILGDVGGAYSDGKAQSKKPFSNSAPALPFVIEFTKGGVINFIPEEESDEK